jgi:hypothetical protein
VWSCFELFCLVLHVCVELLLLNCGVLPILVILWFQPLMMWAYIVSGNALVKMCSTNYWFISYPA